MIGPPPEGEQRVCLSVGPDGSTVAYGDHVLAPTGNDVQIEGIELNGPLGLAYLDSQLVPLDSDSTTVLGSGSSYPPPPEATDPLSAAGYRWADRIPADGAKLPAGSRWNLVMGVRLDAPDRGDAIGVHVLYRSAGKSDDVWLTLTIQVTRPPARCV